MVEGWVAKVTVRLVSEDMSSTKKLYKFLRDNHPQVFHKVAASVFSGKRIAVDANQVLNANFSVALEKVVAKTNLEVSDPDRSEITKEWIEITLRKVLFFIGRGMLPVMIFDGGVRPEKLQTVMKRSSDKKEKAEKVKDLTEKVRGAGLARKQEDLEELKKLWKTNFRLKAEDYNLMYGILSNIGIRCIRAKYDAEEACAVLCYQGFCEAVYSTDQDCLPFGAPVVMIDHGLVKDPKGGSVECFTCVYLEHVMQVLDLDYFRFRDLFIAGGCDLNTNIPGFAMGKTYAQFKKGKSLDQIAAEKKGSECLNLEVCRRVFNLKSWESVILPSEYSEEKGLSLVSTGSGTIAWQALAPYSLQSYTDVIIGSIRQLGEVGTSGYRLPIKPRIVIVVRR